MLCSGGSVSLYHSLLLSQSSAPGTRTNYIHIIPGYSTCNLLLVCALLEHAKNEIPSLNTSKRSISVANNIHACRFGSTDEVGLFEMTRHGLATITDPAALLKERSAAAAAAACAAAVVVEANRPMVVEIQVRCDYFELSCCVFPLQAMAY